MFNNLRKLWIQRSVKTGPQLENIPRCGKKNFKGGNRTYGQWRSKGGATGGTRPGA